MSEIEQELIENNKIKQKKDFVLFTCVENQLDRTDVIRSFIFI